MNYDERDIRAVMFSCDELQDISAIQPLLAPSDSPGPSAPVAVREESLSNRHSSVVGFRVEYTSLDCFYRTADPDKRREFARMKKKGEWFTYEVLVMLDDRTKPPLVLVAIPFAAMALEAYGRIHNRRPSESFKYHRPALDALVAELQTSAGTTTHLTATGVSWLTTGDTAKCSSVTLEGTDVVHSGVFDLLKCAMRGVEIDKKEFRIDGTLRKLNLRYDSAINRQELEFSVDRFGNYTIWATDEGANLCLIFDLAHRLRKRHLLVEETSFPVRNRADTPRL